MRLAGVRRKGGLQAAASLNARLLIGAQHVLVVPQGLSFPAAGVEVEHRTGQFEEVRIAWKDPVLVTPGTQRIPQQPAPDAAARRTRLAAEHVGGFGGEVAQAVPAEWHTAVGGSFAGEGNHQRPRGGRQHRRAAATRSVPQPVAPIGQEPGAPALHCGATHPLLLRQPPCPEPSRAAQNDAGPARQTLGRRSCSCPLGQLLLSGRGERDHAGGLHHRFRTSCCRR